MATRLFGVVWVVNSQLWLVLSHSVSTWKASRRERVLGVICSDGIRVRLSCAAVFYWRSLGCDQWGIEMEKSILVV